MSSKKTHYSLSEVPNFLNFASYFEIHKYMHLFVQKKCTNIHQNNKVIEICFKTPPLQLKVSIQDKKIEKSEMYFPSFLCKQKGLLRKRDCFIYFLLLLFADRHAFLKKVKRNDQKPAYCGNVYMGINKEFKKYAYLI